MTVLRGVVGPLRGRLGVQLDRVQLARSGRIVPLPSPSRQSGETRSCGAPPGLVVLLTSATGAVAVGVEREQGA